MNLDDYQKQSIQTIAIQGISVAALAHRTLGLSGEAGVLANRTKKIIRDSEGSFSEEDRQFAKEKLGDVLYYLSALAEYYGLSLSEVAEGNLVKSTKFKASTKKERQDGRR